jgi:hypothetical protein
MAREAPPAAAEAETPAEEEGAAAEEAGAAPAKLATERSSVVSGSRFEVIGSGQFALFSGGRLAPRQVQLQAQALRARVPAGRRVHARPRHPLARAVVHLQPLTVSLTLTLTGA